VCSLPADQQRENDALRRAVREDHYLLPSLVSSHDLPGCLAAAQRKVGNILKLQDQLLADLPSAYMEYYEFLAIAKVMKLSVKEDPDIYKKKAESLASLLGDKFVHEYQVKLNDILYGS